jgi:hypothetical protein
MVYTDEEGEFSAWIYIPGSFNTTQEATLFVDWYDSSDVFISRTSGDTIDLLQYNGYNRFSLVAKSPNGTAKARVGISYYVAWGAEPPSDESMIYLDDLSFVGYGTTYTASWIKGDSNTLENFRFKDTTNYLKEDGVQVVSFPTQSSITGTINGVSGYWIGMKFASIPGSGFTSPVVKTTPFVPYKNYIEIDGDNLHGDGPVDINLDFRDLTAPEAIHSIFDSVVFDAHGDDSGSSIDSSSATYAMDDADIVGVIFQGIDIKENAYIRKAILSFSPAGVSYNPTGELDLTVVGELGVSTMSNWTAFSQMGSGGSRATTTAVVPIYQYRLSGWDQYDSQIAEDAGRGYQSDVTSIVQEIVSDDDWDNQTKMAFHIDNLITGSGTLDWHSRNAATEASPWSLEVEYVQTDINLRRVYMGSRTVDRGDLFQSHIALTSIPQQYIKHDGSSWSSGTPPSGSSVYARLGYDNAATEEQRFITITIQPPMSYSYSGRFRVLIDGWLEHDLRYHMRYRAGRQSPLVHGDRVKAIDPNAATNFYGIVDLGEMRVSGDQEPDVIEIEIWCEPWAEFHHLKGIYLIPSDEWFGDFAIEGDEPGYGLMDDLSLFIDGITFPFGKPTTTLRKTDGTDRDVGTVRASTTQLQLYPGKDQRVYFLGLHVYDVDTAWQYGGIGVEFPYPHAVYYVSVGSRSRYSSFR